MAIGICAATSASASIRLSNLRSTFNPTVVVPAPLFEQYSIGDSAFVGGGVGYQFNSWLRADVTGEYRTSANYRATQSYTNSGPPIAAVVGGALPRSSTMAQHRAAVFLANGYVDLGTWCGITPYVGGGVGFAVNWLDNLTDDGPETGGFGYAREPQPQTNFAWAVAAGLAYNVSQNLQGSSSAIAISTSAASRPTRSAARRRLRGRAPDLRSRLARYSPRLPLSAGRPEHADDGAAARPADPQILILKRLPRSLRRAARKSPRRFSLCATA